jgi:hypothetical protein
MRTAWSLALMLALASCETGTSLTPPYRGEDVPTSWGLFDAVAEPGVQVGAGMQVEGGVAEGSVTLGEMAKTWGREGDWLVSPLSPTVEGLTRVGVMIELVQPGPLPLVQAQGFLDGAASGDWVRLEPTFSEDRLHVAVAPLTGPADAARLRVALEGVDWVRVIQWSAVAAAQSDEPGLEEGTESNGGALSAPLQGLGVVSRAGWGARPTKCSSSNAAKARVAVHYTVTPSDKPAVRVRAIQAYHMDSKGWCDIGYHFLVGLDGSLYEGRPAHLLGAHVAGHNTGSLGLSFIGCFHSSGCGDMGPVQPPTGMLDAGARLLAALAGEYAIALDAAHVKGHRDFSGADTDCPGDHLYARLGDVRATAAAWQAGNGPEPLAEVMVGPDAVQPEVVAGPEVVVQEVLGPEVAGQEVQGPVTPDQCSWLACPACEAAPACDWCASREACAAADQPCVWDGAVDVGACWPALWPCWVATCWNPVLDLLPCGKVHVDQDFSSGKYSVHRYWTRIPQGAPVSIRLARTGGSFAPALLVTDQAGNVAYGGEAGVFHPFIRVLSATSGRTGGVAEALLEAKVDTDAYLYVTGWSILDAGFHGSLPTSSEYRLTLGQDCAAQ